MQYTGLRRLAGYAVNRPRSTITDRINTQQTQPGKIQGAIILCIFITVIIQGSFSSYQPQYHKNTDNPLLMLHQRIHTLQDDGGIGTEDECRQAAECVFGRNPLPTLESYTINVSL